MVDRWAHFQRAPGHRASLVALNPAAQSVPTPQALAAIAVPALVLWGERDPLLDVQSAHKLAQAIAGDKLVTYPDVGHLPQIEIPLRSAADVAAFLSALTP